jgi:hypothetical protein
MIASSPRLIIDSAVPSFTWRVSLSSLLGRKVPQTGDYLPSRYVFVFVDIQAHVRLTN